MEKNNYCPVKKYLIFFIIMIVFLSEQVSGQIRAGAGTLKFMPGAREVGLAGSVAGALDYQYSFYVNPGAIGFHREWLWSVSYTNWISDIYNASMVVARRIRVPWSNQTRFVMGVDYLGMPEFDSSDGATPPVSGSEYIIKAGIGQPFNPYFSLGSIIKYYYSNLAEYHAQAIVIDLGLSGRTPRFPLLQGIFDYGIFAAGVALTNTGGSIKYVSEGTPLPRTLQMGIAFHAGTHRNFMFSLSSDYRQTRDEDGYMTLGSEISWRDIITLSMGYSFEKNILGQFTFGGGLRIDDLMFQSLIPGRNNALRFNLSANQNRDFFSIPYHGSITHIPIGPEKFNMAYPQYNAVIKSDSLLFSWEKTRDPDLYDDSKYRLIVDQDSSKLYRIIDLAGENVELFFQYLENESFIVDELTAHNVFLMEDLSAGSYYWSVFAYDSDKHIRFAEIDQHLVGRFYVLSPKPKILALDFEYDQWINETDFQGQLKVILTNQTERVEKNITLSLYDSLLIPFDDKITEDNRNQIFEQNIPIIKTEDMKTFAVDWRTKKPGLYQIRAEIKRFDKKKNREIKIDQYTINCYTIPKGSFSIADTVIVLKLLNITYELPFVGKIFFDSSQTKVKDEFIRDWIIEPPLLTLANHLKQFPQYEIKLQGTADPNSGENSVDLANERAKAVHDSLLNFGIPSSQMHILPGEVLPIRKLPLDPLDRKWILQERRRVDILTENSAEEFIFGPSKTEYNERQELPIIFSSHISAIVPMTLGKVLLKSDNLLDSLVFQNAEGKTKLYEDISWQLLQENKEAKDDWIDKFATAYIVLTDSLGRQFKSNPQRFYLDKQSIMRERMYFGIAKFALAEPFYNFYWSNLMERIPIVLKDVNTRMRFIGHACAIGSELVNQRLSEKRAARFTQTFLDDAQKLYPGIYEQLKLKIDKAEAFGETKPFFFRNPAGETLTLGNNATPLGRQLNRRVMILFYTVK